jgi:hypothetical protein
MATETNTTTTTTVLQGLTKVHSLDDQDIYTNNIIAFYEWVNGSTIDQPYINRTNQPFLILAHSLELDISALYTIHATRDNTCNLDILYYNDTSLINFDTTNESDPDTIRLPPTFDDTNNTDDNNTVDDNNTTRQMTMTTPTTTTTTT